MTNFNNYCQAKTAQSGSSFYYSFLFLTPPQRQAITAIYAFCREVDDIVDEYNSQQIAQIKLAWWRTEISRVFHNKAAHPIGLALQQARTNYNLSQELFDEIIQGMQMDLQQKNYKTFTELELYCYRAASAVGLLAIEVFGYDNPSTIEFAKNLEIGRAHV